MINKIDHIGIAVKSIDDMVDFYKNTLGLKIKGTETIEEQKVKTAFIPIGDSEIELLEATTPESTIAKFIEKRGEGIQHIAVRVDDIEKTLADLKAKGIRMIDEVPRYGAGGAKIAFVHPKSTHGILLEICQR